MKISLLILFLSLSSIGAQAQFDLLTHQEQLPCVNKKFSIVAHILLDPQGNPVVDEDNIKSNVEAANTYWEPICVSFEVCDFKIIPNYQFDTLIKEAELDRLHEENHVANRINMYYIQAFEGELEGAAGCASLGGIGSLNGGGLVLAGTGVGTLLHEMGHYFGLPHTFEGSGVELVDGSNCETAGDGICDTPADPFVEGEDMAEYVSDCRFISLKVDANGEYYRPDIGNIMSYYPCTCGFTFGQYFRMAQLAQNSGMW